MVGPVLEVVLVVVLEQDPVVQRQSGNLLRPSYSNYGDVGGFTWAPLTGAILFTYIFAVSAPPSLTKYNTMATTATKTTSIRRWGRCWRWCWWWCWSRTRWSNVNRVTCLQRIPHWL